MYFSSFYPELYFANQVPSTSHIKNNNRTFDFGKTSKASPHILDMAVFFFYFVCKS